MNFQMQYQAKAPPSEDDIQEWLKQHIADSVNAKPEDIDVTKPFSYFGLSSVVAIAISGELEIWIGRKLSPTLTWDFPSIELLAEHLAKS
jgi:acyl carrier protein